MRTGPTYNQRTWGWTSAKYMNCPVTRNLNNNMSPGVERVMRIPLSSVKSHSSRRELVGLH